MTIATGAATTRFMEQRCKSPRCLPTNPTELSSNGTMSTDSVGNDGLVGQSFDTPNQDVRAMRHMQEFAREALALLGDRSSEDLRHDRLRELAIRQLRRNPLARRHSCRRP